jgi:hypothetical protein
MAVTADDQVIMNQDVERLSKRDDLMCQLDVGGRWARIARGMIVDLSIIIRINLFYCCFLHFKKLNGVGIWEQ